MIVAVDFDGVIHDLTRVLKGRKMGPPMDGARDSIVALMTAGHEVIVHTVRGDRPQHVEDWLRYFEFPALTVTRAKPNADVYLDDRAIRFTSWDAALEAIEPKVDA